MDSLTVQIRTGTEPTVVDITPHVAAFARGKGDGLLNVFVPHATAGVAILETGAGSDADLIRHLDTLFPRDDRWTHRHGAPGHGADHVIPAFIAPSISLPVEDGELVLGTWQSVCLVDPNRDNPSRRVRLSFLAG